jgi:hypothetical protein
VADVVRIETDKTIGRVISRQLGLGPYLEKSFVCEVRGPDLQAKLGRRIRSHHGVHPETVMNVIWGARREYLAGDYESALEYLGIALHYVQDGCVARARRKSPGYYSMTAVRRRAVPRAGPPLC